MYYKIDLNNYEPREVPKYQEFTNYNDIKWAQIEMISEELDNFKDSFGKDWKEWTLKDLRDRLQNNWTFYLVEGGWAFIDWNRQYPMLCQKYVFPEHRGTGLNLDLIWIRCNDLVQQGYKTAMMFIDDWNKPAKAVLKEKIFSKMD
jgi:predicted GNAT family acetyltransferase